MQFRSARAMSGVGSPGRLGDATPDGAPHADGVKRFRDVGRNADGDALGGPSRRIAREMRIARGRVAAHTNPTS